MLAGLGAAAEHERCERRGVAADRRLGLLRAGLERPAGSFLGSRPVSCEQERLHGADRPAPAPRRRVSEALAVALGRSSEPLGRLVAALLHHQREPGAAGRVPEPRQLPLPTTDLLSWIFDNPTYDQDKPVSVAKIAVARSAEQADSIPLFPDLSGCQSNESFL